MDYIDKIKRLVENSDLTVKQTALKINKSRAHLNNVFAKKSDFKVSDLITLARVFDVQLFSLFGDYEPQGTFNEPFVEYEKITTKDSNIADQLKENKMKLQETIAMMEYKDRRISELEKMVDNQNRIIDILERQIPHPGENKKQNAG